MEPIISGTTTERIVRATLAAVFVNGFAFSFLWDGYVGYSRENGRQLLRSLGLDAHRTLDVDPELTVAKARRLTGSVQRGTPYNELEPTLGDPMLQHKDQVFYLGPGGHIQVGLRDGRVADIAWVKGVHSETSQAWQRWLGYLLGILGMILLFRLVRAVTTRVSLTDAGLTVRGHPPIPFSAMKSLRPEPSGKIGLIDLDYDIDGKVAVVRLDDYVIKKYDAILKVICEQTGLTDPRTASD